MSVLANRISELTSSLGTAEGLARVNEEIGALNESLAHGGIEISGEEMVKLHAALAALGNAISTISRVTREMLGNVGVGGLNHVG